MTKKQIKQEYWEKHYASYQKSGLSQRAYCKRNDLKYWTFNKWKKRLDKDSPATDFQEISVQLLQDNSSNDRIEILLESGMKILIPDNFSPNSLRGIIEVLS